MKLRTRLIVAFCSIVIGPLLLLTIFTFGFGMARVRQAEKSYGIELSADALADFAQLFNESTQPVWEEMRAQAEERADRFLEEEYLEELNERLRQKLSYLLLLQEGKIRYQGMAGALKGLIRAVPGYGEGEESGRGVYLGEKVRSIVKQLDLRFSDGSKGSAYIVTSVGALMPGVRRTLIQIGAAVFFVLLITAAAIVWWIYSGVNAPIGKLRAAARRIAAGDLDFTLEVDGGGEIGELTADFEAMRRRLKESEEEKERYDRENRELISNISHDLKTPVTTVKGYVEGIIDGVADTPEKLDRYIRTIYSKANDMDRLINELTYYSRIDTSRIRCNFSLLDVGEFFDDCAEELCMELEGKGFRFTYENRVERGTRIIADPEQLKRVISNIIGNSIKYTDKPKGRIDLRILDAGDFIQTEIEDNGKGIEPKDLPNIFDRFYRSDTARTTAQGGSGIGLSIVKKIIEDHSGKIWAESSPGRWTKLSFVIRKYQEQLIS